MFYPPLVGSGAPSRTLPLRSPLSGNCSHIGQVFNQRRGRDNARGSFRSITDQSFWVYIYSFIQRLMMMTIQTGSASSILATFVAIGFHVDSLRIVAHTIVFLLGSVYVITVLYVLNSRNEQRRESAAWNTVLFANDGMRSGVHVHRTVYVDDGKTNRASTPQSEPSHPLTPTRKTASSDFPLAV